MMSTLPYHADDRRPPPPSSPPSLELREGFFLRPEPRRGAATESPSESEIEAEYSFCFQARLRMATVCRAGDSALLGG